MMAALLACPRIPPGGVVVVADSSTIGSSSTLPSGADDPLPDRTPSFSGLLAPGHHGEACCPAHWATVDTSACRGNTFSVRTRWTSGSASRQASARTVSW